jgi:hypothetical protein
MHANPEKQGWRRKGENFFLPFTITPMAKD